MKYFIGFISATVLWIALLAFIPMPTEVVYDCSIAEFHPDFPPKVKEECRRLRRDSSAPSKPTSPGRIV
jgi:hypothetical protein